MKRVTGIDVQPIRIRWWWSGGMLAVGGALYVLFRPVGILVTVVLRTLGFGMAIDTLRRLMAGVQLPDVVVYSLPGGLWSAAYILLMDALWRGRRAWLRCGMVALVPLVGAGSEVLQALHWLPGTADAADALCYLLPYILYMMYELSANKKITW